MIGLKHIAKEAGVSVMAVSKALRDEADISVITKNRIRQIADRLGYIPNGNARGLRAQRTGLIGVIVPHLDNDFFSKIVSGILRDAAMANYQVIVAQSHNNVSLELQELRAMLGRRVDGIILTPVARINKRLEFLDLLSSRDVSVVFIDRFPAGAMQYSKAGCVVAEDQRGAELAVTHLIEKGHRRILHLAGSMGASSTEERLSGYRRGLAKAGIPYSDDLVFRAGITAEEGIKAMTQALNEGAKFSAVFAVSDGVAIGACEVLFSQKIRIPEEVSVIGFGDTRMARYYRVPLNTIRQGHEMMGAAGFAALMQILEGKKTEIRIMPVELVERDSVTFCPQ